MTEQPGTYSPSPAPESAIHLIEGTPVFDREETINGIVDWLSTQPTTLALFRYPRLEIGATPGFFTNLGETKLIAIEQDHGTRDGHEYWKQGNNWSVHVRWYGIHWIFLHLQRRFDDQRLREVLEYGEILFDKVELTNSLRDLARKALIYKRVSAREVYHHRVNLAAAVNDLNDLYSTGGAVEPQHLDSLFKVYLSIIRIAESLTTKSEDRAKAEIALKLGRAGKSRLDFSSAVLILQDMVDRLLRKLGGIPKREFYAPATAVHFMPPDATRPPETDEEQILGDEFMCLTCERRFATLAGSEEAVIISDIESAPAILRVSEEEISIPWQKE